MLTQLYVRDFAIVRELSLAYEPGFTVLTGETGAGKPLPAAARALVLGERADSEVIRHGCARAEVSAGFALKPSQDAAKWLKENDLFGDKECVLRRVIEADKPSRGFINGRPVPIQMLRELGEYLVDIHGQHEHQSLLRRDAQRQILDDYAGLEVNVRALTGHYREMESLRERLATLKQQTSDREARVELLRYQVRELDALGLAAGEIPSLEEEHTRLANGAELIEGVQSLAHAIQEAEEAAVAHQLARAISRLETLVQYDAKLGEIIALLNEAAIQIDEAGGRLTHYLDSLERLEQDLEKARAVYFKTAKDISHGRQSAAKTLAKSVTNEMQELGMPGGNFEVILTSLPEDEAGAYGLERVEFQVSANPGQPARPLAKVASGGELSRISLA